MKSDLLNLNNQIPDELRNKIRNILEEMKNPTELLEGRNEIVQLLLPYNIDLVNVFIFDDYPDLSVEEALNKFNEYCQFIQENM